MKTKYIILLLLLLFSIPIYSQLPADYGLYGMWAKRAAFGSGGHASINTSTVDESGNVYLSGTFAGTLNFSDDICNPRISTAAKVRSLFLVKFNKEGKYQWHIVFDVMAGTQSVGHFRSIISDYHNGKLLFHGSTSVIQGTAGTMSIKATLNSTMVSSVSHTKAEGTGIGNDGTNNISIFHFLYVIDTNTGNLLRYISPFVSGTAEVVANLYNNEVHTVHMGYHAATYPSNNSVVSVFNASTGTQIGSNIVYPNQPVTTPGNESKVYGHHTLPSGRNAMLHLSTKVSGPDLNIPTHYLLIYENNYGSKIKEYTLSDRAIQYHPRISSDASDNLYLATNYGFSKYWNNWTNIPNSNYLSNFLGSGQNFYTFPQTNKVVLSKLNPTFTNVEWILQIGGPQNDATNKNEVYANDMKTVGNYTYLVGKFKGNNVPFGNGKTLSSGSDYDGFYAVYDNSDGKCVYAINIGGSSSESNSTLYMSPDGSQVLIGGEYRSSVFQSDPSDRLYALSSDGLSDQGFVTLYSTSSLSSPTPYPSSYGDAPMSYGTAVNYAYPCIRLGNLILDSIQSIPEYSLNASTAKNDDGIDITYSSDYIVDLTGGNFKLDALGNLTATIKVHNATSDNASLIGWIDFNKNGVFDGASEADSVMIPANTTAPNSTATLVWKGANAKMQNGITYMRLRITTDNITKTQPSGLFFNGEVEDYRLDFDLLGMTKSAESDNSDPTKANIGDTITYTIKLTNNTPAPINNISVFDPVPGSTKYIDNSAKYGSTVVTGSLPTNVTVNGQTAPSIVWTPFNLAAGATSDALTFKVVVIGKPVDTDSIFNIAYAVVNGDTITSADAGCNLAEIGVKGLFAEMDYFAVWRNTNLANAHIGANDVDPDRNFVRDTILWVKEGVATLKEPRDGTLTYITRSNYLGIDSLAYRVKIINDSVDTKAYFAVIATESQQYAACPGSPVQINLLPNNNSRITYDWYTTSTGGVSFASGVSATVTMGAGTTTVYVQVKIDGNETANRLPVYIDLAANCGGSTPVNCATDGTLLYQQDFGGNDITDPDKSTTPLKAGITNYTFNSTIPYHPNAGEYSIHKGLQQLASTWVRFDDHTHNGYDKGYLMLVNAGNSPGIFYADTIKDVCAGVELYFSAWVGNLVRTSSTTYLDPKLRFVLEDATNGTVLATFNTGSIPKLSDTDGQWKQYGFNFTVSTASSICFKIYNDQAGSATGNDLVLDDIEVRFCAPKVNVTIPVANDTLVCQGGQAKLSGNYNDLSLGSPVFTNGGESLKARWEYSTTGNVQAPADWSMVGTEITVPSPATTLNLDYNIASMLQANEGYYRLVVGNANTINQYNCRAMSRVIHVKLNNQPTVYPDVRIQSCTNSGNINLTSYLDTLNVKSVTWSASVNMPVIGATTGIVNSNNMLYPGTYIYKFKIENTCGYSEGNMYVKTLQNSTIGLPPDTVVICYKYAENIQLNRIFGIEAKGTLTSDDSNVRKYITTAVNPPHTGAAIFNGYKAYTELGGWYDYIYHGVVSKKVEFKYKITDPTSCLYGISGKEYKLVMILTTDITQ